MLTVLSRAGSMTTPRCVVKWPGGKWAIAGWIAAQLPTTPVYLELFFGSGAVLVARPPSIAEMANDLDDQVVNLFEIIRERPDELAAALELTPWSRVEWERAMAAPRPRGRPSKVEEARRFVVAQWMSHGHRREQGSGWRNNGPTSTDHSVTTTWRVLPERVRVLAERLMRVQFENRPALDVLTRNAGPDVLVYADPPYLGAVRRNKKIYRHELMAASEHGELLEALDAHPGPVALSHYRCDLYDQMLLGRRGWVVTEVKTVAEHGKQVVEALFTNPTLQALMATTRRQVGLFEGAAAC